MSAIEAPAALSHCNTVFDALHFHLQDDGNKLMFGWINDNGKVERTLTRNEFDIRVANYARYLTTNYQVKPGDRLVLAYPPNLEFVVVFYACMYLKCIPVPVSVPLPDKFEIGLKRLYAIVNDCGAKLILTDAVYRNLHKLKLAELFVTGQHVDSDMQQKKTKWITTNALKVKISKHSTTEMYMKGASSIGDNTAYLQYTSGSTGTPKGVIVTHDALINQCKIFVSEQGSGLMEDSVAVSWVPVYHDMGLIGSVLATPYRGAPSYIMSPLSFLKSPYAWLKCMSDLKCTHTGVPTFALHLCATRVPESKISKLDLSPLVCVGVGAEPVRQPFIRAFVDKFGRCGFREGALSMCYGLAEHVLAVTRRPRQLSNTKYIEVDRRSMLMDGVIQLCAVGDDSGVGLTGTGEVAQGVTLKIVDPETSTEMKEGRIGEIWIQSPSVAKGYYNRPDATAETFQAHLKGAPAAESHSHYLRTGDLGFLLGCELYVTGRIKDVIIVNGVNHYPQDIEYSVELSHELIRRGCVAAFNVSSGEADGAETVEKVVIVAEVKPANKSTLGWKSPSARAENKARIAEIMQSIIREVRSTHGLSCADVVLLPPRTIPKTTSGKISRRPCKEAFKAGTLPSLSNKKSTGLIDNVAKNSQIGSHTPTTLRARDVHAPAFQSRCNSTPAAPQLEGISFMRNTATARSEETVVVVIGILAAVLEVPATSLTQDTELSAMGLDSVKVFQFASDLTDRFDVEIEPTDLFRLTTCRALGEHIYRSIGGKASANTPKIVVSSASTDIQVPNSPSLKNMVGLTQTITAPVSVVGVSCNLPGNVRSPQDFWDLLMEKRCAVTKAMPSTRGTGKWPGGYLHSAVGCDGSFFGIARAEAASMDPAQMLLLESVYHALEDASIPPESIKGTRTGVFVGYRSGEYGRQLAQTGVKKSGSAGYAPTGTAGAIMANRVSYVFDLTGPSLVVDTACSSSLVAVHFAVQSLRRGECTTAIVAGVNLLLMDDTTEALFAGGFMSATGKCHAFDNDADGYVRGEGCGVVVLRLSNETTRASHRVYADVCGSAVNQDGRSNGLSAPNPTAQREVILESLRCAGVTSASDMRRVEYIEAHGTGTKLGDPIEVSAINAAIGTDGPPVHLGAVKTNIGHLEAAAGIVGLIKVCLAAYNGVVPPSVHSSTPNTLIAWDKSRLRLVREEGSSLSDEAVLGISGFGFGGTNAHLSIKRVPSLTGQLTGAISPSHFIMPIAAQTSAECLRLTRHYQKLLDSKTTTQESDATLAYFVAATSALSRPHFGVGGSLNRVAGARMVVVGQTSSALAKEMKAHTGPVAVSGHLSADRKRAPGIAFMFTGQGSQYLGMGYSLFKNFAVYRTALIKCADILKSVLIGTTLYDMLGYSKIATSASKEGINHTAHAQITTFCLEYGLLCLFQSWGLQPTVVLGHSLGEISASVAAGMYTLEDALPFVVARARAMANAHTAYEGAMLACNVSETAINDITVQLDHKVSVAAINGPASVVVSGSVAAIEEVATVLKAKDIKHKRLSVSHAFHSDLMHPAKAALGLAADKLQTRPASGIDFVSCLHGASTEQLESNHWQQHLVQPVRFSDAMKTVAERKDTSLYLELGPQPVLINMGKRCGHPNQTGATWLSAMPPRVMDTPEDEVTCVLSALGRLYERGVEVDWSSIYNISPLTYTPSGVTLPPYPFESGGVLDAGRAQKKPAEVSTQGQHPNEPLTMSVVLEEITEMFRNSLPAASADGAVNDVSADTDFYVSGGNSLDGVQLVNRIQKQYNVDLPFGKFMQAPTPRTTAALVVAASSGEGATDGAMAMKNSSAVLRDDNLELALRQAGQLILQYPQGKDMTRPKRYTMSSNQVSMYTVTMRDPDDVCYNIGLPMRVHGAIDIDRLRLAARAVIVNNPQLAAVFESSGSYREDAHVRWESSVVEVFEVDAGIPLEKAAQLQIDQPIRLDATETPLVKIKVFVSKENPDLSLLLVCGHHIAMDGISMLLVVDQLLQAYGGKNIASSTPVIYDDFTQLQETYCRSPEAAQTLQYYRHTLIENGTCRPLHFPVSPNQSSNIEDTSDYTCNQARGGQVSFELPSELKQKLDAYEHAKPVVMLAAYYAMLVCWTGLDDTVIGVVTHGRPDVRFANNVGHFVNPVPVRLGSGRDNGYGGVVDLVGTVKERWDQAMAHADYPLERLVRDLGLRPAKEGTNPVFEALFAVHVIANSAHERLFDGQKGETFDLHGTTLERSAVVTQAGAITVNLDLKFTSRAVSGQLQWRKGTFSRKQAQSMVSDYLQILDSLLTDSQISLRPATPTVASYGHWYQHLRTSPEDSQGLLLCEYTTSAAYAGLTSFERPFNTSVDSPYGLCIRKGGSYEGPDSTRIRVLTTVLLVLGRMEPNVQCVGIALGDICRTRALLPLRVRPYEVSESDWMDWTALDIENWVCAQMDSIQTHGPPSAEFDHWKTDLAVIVTDTEYQAKWGDVTSADALASVNISDGGSVSIKSLHATEGSAQESFYPALPLAEAMATALDYNHNQTVRNVDLVSSVAFDRMCNDWNSSDTIDRELAADTSLLVHERITHQASILDHAYPAVVYKGGEQVLTYRQLEQHANQLAHVLRAAGVGPDVAVGLCAEPSTDMVIGMLAVLKAGGYYVPLAPSYPIERVRTIVSLLDLQTVVVSSKQATTNDDRFDGLRVLSTARECLSAHSGEHGPARHPTSGIRDLMYTLFTSGSTGTPKGVQIEHRGVLNLLENHGRRVGHGKRALLTTSYTFDPSVMVIFGTLATGGTLFVEDLTDLLQNVAHVINDRAIEYTVLTPRMLELVRPDSVPCLQTLDTGGECMSLETARLWGKRLYNDYGPTEATVTITTKRCDSEQNYMSIGRPLNNCPCYVLDAQLQPVPEGQPGVLYVGGPQLARGYVGRPDLTAAVFTESEVFGRLYNTGDMVRYIPGTEGEIEWLGRVDSQVKLHGHRIELKEIECVTKQVEGVSGAVALLSADADNLLLFWIGVRTVADERIAENIRKHLPPYMVPSYVQRLDAIPLTLSGKTDTAALRQAYTNRHSRAEKVSDAEQTSTEDEAEETLIRIWKQVLKISEVPLDGNFFTIGGHSLAVMQVIGIVRDEHGVDLPVRQFYETPTVRALAPFLREDRTPTRPIPVNAASIELAADLKSDPSKKLTGAAMPGEHIAIPLGHIDSRGGLVVPASVLMSTSKDSLDNQSLRSWVAVLLAWLIAGCQLVALGVLVIATLAPLYVVTYGATELADVIGAYIILVMPVAWLLYGLALSAVVVLCKWILLGRVEPIVSKRQSFYFVRWWFVSRLAKVCDTIFWQHLRNTLAIVWYQRALGATVGQGVRLGCPAVCEGELLSIGDGCVVANTSLVLAHRVERGRLHLEKVALGAACRVGSKSVVCGGSTVAPGVTMEPLTATVRDATAADDANESQTKVHTGVEARTPIIEVLSSDTPTAHLGLLYSLAQCIGLYLSTLVVSASAGLGYYVFILLATEINLLPVAQPFYERGSGYVLAASLFIYHPVLAPFAFTMTGVGNFSVAVDVWSYVTTNTGFLQFIGVLALMITGLALSLMLSSAVLVRLLHLAGRRSAAVRIGSVWHGLRWASWTVAHYVDKQFVVLFVETWIHALWLKALGVRSGSEVTICPIPYAPERIVAGSRCHVPRSAVLEQTSEHINSRGEWVETLETVTLACDVVVGSTSVIRAGTTIGKGCLVGAFTCPPLVCEDYATYVGQPPICVPNPAAEANLHKFLARIRGLFVTYVMPVVVVFMCLACFLAASLPAGVLLLYVRDVSNSRWAGLAIAPVVYLIMVVSVGIVTFVVRRLFVGKFTNESHDRDHFVTSWQRMVLILHEYTAAHIGYLLAGTSWYNTLFRVMGASIGKDVYIETDQLFEADLIRLGDGTSVAGDVSILPHAYQRGSVELGPITIQANAVIGPQTLLHPGTIVQTGATVQSGTYLMRGQVVKQFGTVAGSPAVSV